MATQNRPKRISPKFAADMELILNERVKAGLMSYKDAKMPKATELLTRTVGYQQSLRELKMKPEKK